MYLSSGFEGLPRPVRKYIPQVSQEEHSRSPGSETGTLPI